MANNKDPRICSRCGKKFDLWDDQQDFTIHRVLGYGCTHDGDEIDYCLCCDCIDKAIDECAVSPVISSENW